jgi:predicted transcriptional regulator YdeE
MMDCKTVKKSFRIVGIKGSGLYTNFGTEVPKLAEQFLDRLNEVVNSTGKEVAFFEPKRDANHVEGIYYVGIIVNETINEVPVGMELIETTQYYITTRGKMNNISSLHNTLLKWADEHGFKRDLESFIVETYHSMENGEEEVEVYLPILSL